MLEYRIKYDFVGVYRCVNSAESITFWMMTRQDKYFIKPKTSVHNGIIVKRMYTTDDWHVNWHNAYTKVHIIIE